MQIRRCEPADRGRVDDFLHQRGADRVARIDELVDATQHPALIAEDGSRLLGVLTYVIKGRSCEVLTLHAADRFRGVGTALLRHIEELARRGGCNRLWLITTNDNITALRFYQRRGLRLEALRPGAVDRTRRHLKPQIPPIGDEQIPLRDEILLAKEL